jgi:hypothetical protein
MFQAMLRIVALGLCLLAVPSQAFAEGLYCAVLEASVPLDKQRPPTVRYEVHTIPGDILNAQYCVKPGDQVVGCAYPVLKARGWRYIIVISDTVSAEEYPCVLAYEKAHLPPNCWGSPTMETPDAMEYARVECPTN